MATKKITYGKFDRVLRTRFKLELVLVYIRFNNLALILKFEKVTQRTYYRGPDWRVSIISRQRYDRIKKAIYRDPNTPTYVNCIQLIKPRNP